MPNKYLDSEFEFDISMLSEYVKKNSFDAIAITNHNLFDEKQFLTILRECQNLGCTCFPGIEVSLEGGHILVIGEANESSYSILRSISKRAEADASDEHYSMSVSTFNTFLNAQNFLLIPHLYGKSPKVSDGVIKNISRSVDAGEAANQKKFFIAKKTNGPTPVCFSDIRIKKGLTGKGLQNFDKLTYVKIDGVVTLASLKKALTNGCNVAVGKSFLEDTYDILDGDAEASTGINVLIGKRSSGKTHTLNEIYQSLGGEYSKDVLYIKQFDIQKDAGDINKKLQAFAVDEGKDYCSDFQAVIEYMDGLHIGDKEDRVPGFLDSLKKHAEYSKQDEYSKAALYSYSPNEVVRGASDIDKMTTHVEALLDAANDLSKIIEKHIEREKLVALFKELVLMKKKEEIAERVRSIAEEIAKNVSESLATKSVSVAVDPFDFSALLQVRYARKRFNELVENLKTRTIADEDIFHRFKRVTEIGPIPPRREMKTVLGLGNKENVDFLYNSPKTDVYLKITSSPLSQNATGDLRWRYFLYTNSRVKNSYGADLSGGQCAEYCLLDRLRDKRKYQYVLIDELEPSFDNPFLHEQIIPYLQDISQSATVFVSTHNNNLGVSLNPDQYIYHEVENGDSGDVRYRIYFGPSSSKTLHDSSQNELPLSKILMTTMEAGESAYKERRGRYEDSQN